LTANPHSPNAHRLGDILENLRAHIFEGYIDLAANLAVSIVGNANTPGLRDPFEARCNIDAVAKDIAVVDYNIADVNADAKLDAIVVGLICILLGHAALNFDGASRCIDGAGKLDQHAVASRLDDASAVLDDAGVDERFSEGLEMSKRAFLVGTHQAAIASDIRRQNSR
jgi:hypothetical protein